MRSEVLDRLRCVACADEGVEAGYEIDPIRIGGGDEGGAPGDVIEAYLVCRRCRSVRPIVAGAAVLPRDLPLHVRAHENVWRRAPIADPRMTRFVLGLAAGGAPEVPDFVPFAEVIDRYGDLAAPLGDAVPRTLAWVDAALDQRLRDEEAAGPALDVGCGVGRGTFVLAARTGDAVGVDRSAARVRRARNVQTAEEFLLPPPGGDRPPGNRGERPIDLSRLERARADFAVAEAEALPFRDGSFRTTVLRLGDGEGTWADPARALAEAVRVTAAGGLVIVEAVESVADADPQRPPSVVRTFQSRRLQGRAPTSP